MREVRVQKQNNSVQRSKNKFGNGMSVFQTKIKSKKNKNIKKNHEKSQKVFGNSRGIFYFFILERCWEVQYIPTFTSEMLTIIGDKPFHCLVRDGEEWFQFAIYTEQNLFCYFLYFYF